MKKGIIKIIAACLILISCQKEKDAASSYADDYRFFFKAKVDGLPVEMNAGENGYFLETNYYFIDSLVVMEGVLAADSSPQQNAITIRIRSNRRIASVNDFDLNESLKTGQYAFRDATGYRAEVGKYLLSFFGDTTIANLTYHWQFADGSSSYSANPQKVLSISEADPYEVNLQTSVNGCQSSVTHFVNLSMDCDGTFTLQYLAGLILKVNVIERIGTITHIDWYLDGVSVVPDMSGEINLNTYINPKKISCVLTFADGCTKQIDRKLDGSILNSCTTDFWYEKQKQKVYDPGQYSTVEIEYFNENGKKYSSYYKEVVGDFNMVSTSPYDVNQEGQATTRFFFESNTVLKNADGTSVELSNAFGSFAVAHP